MNKVKLPLEVNSDLETFTLAISNYLANIGVQDVKCLTAGIRIVAAFDKYLNGYFEDAVKELKPRK